MKRCLTRTATAFILDLVLVGFLNVRLNADWIIEADEIHTVSGPVITSGVILIRSNKFAAIGPASSTSLPEGIQRKRIKIVTPGLTDARTVVGLSGLLNQKQDQEQLDSSAPIQPELRAIDAYNPRDPLVEYVRSLGVTTIHTGHAPGALVAGQTMIVKTYTVQDDRAIINPLAMIAATLGKGSTSDKPDKAPGTKAKALAMLRAEFIKALEYSKKQKSTDIEKRPARDLKLDALSQILDRSIPLLVTAQSHADILAAIRIANEFQIRLVLDSTADAHLVLGEIKNSSFPVIVHPTQWRAAGEAENLSLETPAKLRDAGIQFAFQSGFESYVPKTRIVLFEAAVAAANELGFRDALAGVTLRAAQILGISERVGSIEIGKDADLAFFDGDPFEYTSHCLGVMIDGDLIPSAPR